MIPTNATNQDMRTDIVLQIEVRSVIVSCLRPRWRISPVVAAWRYDDDLQGRWLRQLLNLTRLIVLFAKKYLL